MNSDRIIELVSQKIELRALPGLDFFLTYKIFLKEQ